MHIVLRKSNGVPPAGWVTRLALRAVVFRSLDNAYYNNILICCSYAIYTHIHCSPIFYHAPRGELDPAAKALRVYINALVTGDANMKKINYSQSHLRAAGGAL